MSGHGPDAATFANATRADTSQPHKVSNTMAFMFETKTIIRPSRHALASPQLQPDYWQCWQTLPKNFAR
jgi:homogentisate 1,2-dioxygenase